MKSKKEIKRNKHSEASRSAQRSISGTE
uniref:Uncharacterized protein n=1 Tax=Arundo donax TaxID=35708 RepID=A0A0A9BY79_ARUDO